MSADKPSMRDVANEAAARLRQAGMDPRKADQAAQSIARQVDRKLNGEPTPERFRPISDARKGR